MPRLFTLQTNFSSGELDPLMHFRVDTGAYRNGARKLRNALLFSSGGVARRPGTYHRAVLQGATRLLGFEFASDERYVLALSDARLDIYDNDGTFLSSVTSGCNWTSATLFELTYAQRADTLIVCHPSWHPQVITRTSASSFTVSDFAFSTSVNGEKTYQPYFKFALDDVTLEASATNGSATITASADVFTADMVGDMLRWHDTEIEITAYTSATVVTGTIKGTLQGELDNNPFRTADGSNVIEVTHVQHGFATGESVTLSGAGDVGGELASQINGAQTITVIDDNRWSFTTAGAPATESIDGGGPSVKFTGANLPTRQWSEQAFSASNGYPGAVAFHEGRLWFGGSSGIPDGLWSSRLFQYFNFDVGDASIADSIQVTVGADDVSNIRHLVSNNDLQAFTATAEIRVFAPRELSLTPGNINTRIQTPYGCGFATPYPFDGATLYLQANGGAVREFLFSEASQRYASTNLNVLAGHLLSNPYSMAVLYGGASRNEQYAYLVNDDGTLAIFYSARSEELAGWTYWDQGGEGSPAFKDACVLGTEVFIVSLRDSVYYLEKLSPTRTMTLDGATAYTNGTAQSAWTVGSRYYGMTVSVISDGYYLGAFAVDGSGNLTLDSEVDNIIVGYDYTFQIKTLPVDVVLDTGPTIGLPKRIARVFVGLDATQSLSISGNRLLLRQVEDAVEDVPDAVTGTYSFRLLGYQKDAFVELTQNEPLPATVLGMSLEVQL